MEHTLSAPTDGVVKEIHFVVDDRVEEGVALLSLVKD